MSIDELDLFLEKNRNIEWSYNEKERCFLFRDTNLPWYYNNVDNATCITMEKLESMTNDDLIIAIKKGLEVEGITRITGYMTKVSNWNPGKRAELKDRNKNEGAFG